MALAFAEDKTVTLCCTRSGAVLVTIFTGNCFLAMQAAWLKRMEMSVYCLVCLSTTLAQTEINNDCWIDCHKIFHSPQKMNHYDFGDHQTFPLVTMRLILKFFRTISQQLFDEFPWNLVTHSFPPSEWMKNFSSSVIIRLNLKKCIQSFNSGWRLTFLLSVDLLCV